MNKRQREEALMVEISGALYDRMVDDQQGRARLTVTMNELQQQFPHVPESFLSRVLMNFAMTIVELNETHVQTRKF